MQEPPLTAASALRRVLLEDPAEISSLAPEVAKQLTKLFEVNRLEAALHDRVRRLGREDSLPPALVASWRMAYLLAVARSAAYREALEELMELATARGIPVRLLGPAQVAFHAAPAPELRPLAELDVQVPPGSALELQSTLKSRRFFGLEDLVPVDYATHHHLRPLVRDGVTIRIHHRSTLDLQPAPWDPFPEEAPADLSRPLLLPAEALALLICHQMASRRFRHSLLLLHDLHSVVTRLAPRTSTLVRVASAASLGLEAHLGFWLLDDLLGPCFERDLLPGLEELTTLSAPRTKLLRKLARTALLQYPASLRVLGLIGSHLTAGKREALVLAAPVHESS